MSVRKFSLSNSIAGAQLLRARNVAHLAKFASAAQAARGSSKKARTESDDPQPHTACNRYIMERRVALREEQPNLTPSQNYETALREWKTDDVPARLLELKSQLPDGHELKGGQKKTKKKSS